MFENALRHAVVNGASKAFLATSSLILLCLTAPMAQAQTFMSEDELLATIPGSSVYSKTNEGVSWAQNYGKANGKRKGAIKGVFDGAKYDAKWFVKEGQWCENWGDGEGCWSVEQVDAKSLRMYEGGKPRPNLWKLK